MLAVAFVVLCLIAGAGMFVASVLEAVRPHPDNTWFLAMVLGIGWFAGGVCGAWELLASWGFL